MIEPQDKAEFLAAMHQYYDLVRSKQKNGAVFFAVCRGKVGHSCCVCSRALVSEGLDFADEFGRAVVITGLPYPPYKDPKVHIADF